MKTFSILVLVASLVGCANTPQNRALWEGIAAGMNDASRQINEDARQMRENLQRANQQQNANKPINCVTTYDRGVAITNCY